VIATCTTRLSISCKVINTSFFPPATLGIWYLPQLKFNSRHNINESFPDNFTTIFCSIFLTTFFPQSCHSLHTHSNTILYISSFKSTLQLITFVFVISFYRIIGIIRKIILLITNRTAGSNVWNERNIREDADMTNIRNNDSYVLDVWGNLYGVTERDVHEGSALSSCCLNFHTLATKSWSQVAGLRVGANRKRSEFGLFYCTVPAFAWRSWRKTHKA